MRQLASALALLCLIACIPFAFAAERLQRYAEGRTSLLKH